MLENVVLKVGGVGLRVAKTVCVECEEQVQSYSRNLTEHLVS